MKVSISKINIDVNHIKKVFCEMGKTIASNKKLHAGLVSIPVLGWISSEIHREIDNKKHQEQVALYQEALRKHQAEIDNLKSDKEREEYKKKLWEILSASSAGVQNE